MGLFRFVFEILIIVPVAVVMLIVFRKLIAEYNTAVRKERDIKNGGSKRNEEPAGYARMKKKNNRKERE